MQERTAITTALVLSGKYDLPGQNMTVKGFDAYGQPIEEMVPALDSARLEADVEKIMQGELPSPLRRISSIEAA